MSKCCCTSNSDIKDGVWKALKADCEKTLREIRGQPPSEGTQVKPQTEHQSACVALWVQHETQTASESVETPLCQLDQCFHTNSLPVHLLHRLIPLIHQQLPDTFGSDTRNFWNVSDQVNVSPDFNYFLILTFLIKQCNWKKPAHSGNHLSDQWRKKNKRWKILNEHKRFLIAASPRSQHPPWNDMMTNPSVVSALSFIPAPQSQLIHFSAAAN